VHDLRHCAATLMIANGLPVNVVSAILGHAQNSTTLNVYSHVLPAAHVQAAATMDRLLG
jgi:integrase